MPPAAFATARTGRPRPWWRTGLVLGLAAACLLPTLHAETLTLADCLRETAEHNPAILQQRANIERAFANRITLRARAMPSLSIAGIAGVLNEEQNVVNSKTVIVNGKPRTVTNGSNQITNNTVIALGTGGLFQPIFDAAIPASFRRGTAETLAAEQNFYSVASTQLHAARLLFYQTLYQQGNGELLRQSDAVLAENVKSQNQLVTAGLAGRTALLSAEVQRANFNPGILTAGGTYRTDLASLLQTMGRELPYHRAGEDPLATIRLDGSLDDTAISFDAAAATETALARRPDLRALRQMVKMGQEDVNIARAGYYPLIRLYLQGEYVPGSTVRNRPNAVRQSDQVETTEIRPGVTGNWVVIDPGTTRGAVRSQTAARDLVTINLRRLETNLPADLANVHTRLADAAARLAALRGNVDAAQDTLNIIQGGVAQGINSQTEFLFAQTDLLTLKTGLLSARLEMSLARAEFDRLTGNYLRYIEDEPAPTSRRPATK